MDDHHHQPIWPMVQGAANYAWNLIEEAWGMIWKPRSEAGVTAARTDLAGKFQVRRGEMQEVISESRKEKSLLSVVERPKMDER